METCSLRVVEGTTTIEKTTRLSLPAGSFLFGAYPRSAPVDAHHYGAHRQQQAEQRHRQRDHAAAPRLCFTQALYAAPKLPVTSTVSVLPTVPSPATSPR
jgi:hypothetical protein